MTAKSRRQKAVFVIYIASVVTPITASVAPKSAFLKSGLCGRLTPQPQRTWAYETIYVNQEKLLKSSFAWGKKTAG